MDNLKKCEKRLFDSQYKSIYWVIAFEMVLHMLFLSRLNVGDDLTFSHVLDESNIIEWSIQFYQTWSSRIFINVLGALLPRINPWVWKLLNVGVIALLLCSITKIFVVKNRKECAQLLACMFLLYPFMHQVSAGWVMTTLNYLWPTSAGIYGCILLKKSVLNERVKWYEYICCTIAAVFACCAEQVAVVVVVIALFVCIYCIKRRYQLGGTLIILSIGVAGLVNHLLCPGNAERTKVAIAICDPDFPMLSFVQKLQLGFSETASHLFYEPNWIFLFFTGCVMLAVWPEAKCVFAKLISAVPFGVCLCIGFLYEPLSRLFPQITVFSARPTYDYFSAVASEYGALITIDNFRDPIIYIPLMIMVLCVFLIPGGILLGIQNRSLALLIILIYFCGIGSGMIMGFSPTLYASSMRPYTTSYFCFMIVALLVFQNSYEKFGLRIKRSFFPVFFSITIIVTLDTVIQIIRIYELYV